MKEPHMPDAVLGQLVVTAEAEVERHPDCPVCGGADCEINHLATEEQT